MNKLIYISLLLFFVACQKDEKKYVYQVQEVYVEQPGADKPNVKASKQYISIAYSDVFGKAIPSTTLEDLTTTYIAFGDVAVVEDLIIRNFLNSSEALVPTDAQMRADIPTFIKNSFNQFYGREPNEQELWFFQKKITDNPALTPDVIYYSLLTSNEYRQF
jgi:hypothetical protein